MNKLKFWYKNARPVALPQSLMPALAAVALSMGYEEFKWYMALIAVIGICLAHLSMNLFDDYFDYIKKETGFRESLVREGIRARTAKCPYLTTGKATIKELLRVAILYGAAACFFGILIFINRGFPVVWIVLATGILGIFYSADPLRLSYRGLGEIVIGVIFGLLLAMGVSIASCGVITLPIIFIGICMGLLVMNILYTHSFLDYEADIHAGKLTLAGLLKTDFAKLTVSWIFNFIPYVLIIAGVILGIMPAWYLLVLVTLPWAVQLFISMVSFSKNPDKKIKKVFWHEPMPNWDRICQAGLEWFMFRWYLSRNMLTVFTLILIGVSIAIAVSR